MSDVNDPISFPLFRFVSFHFYRINNYSQSNCYKLSIWVDHGDNIRSIHFLVAGSIQIFLKGRVYQILEENSVGIR